MEEVIKVLVTGAGGQLGKCLQKVAGNYPHIHFDFRDKSTLDITNPQQVRLVFQKGSFDYCINTAAYTNVDEAERIPQQAYAVNTYGVKILANTCSEFEVCMLHISTDYVFDGAKDGAYTTEDIPNPINEYGKSKWEGEKQVQQVLDRYFIVRTSWLYSEFGPNFYTKILEKARRGETLYVTDAQKGCPTNATNLVTYVVSLISDGRVDYGIKHFTDGAAMSWFDFACQILRENQMKPGLMVIRDKNYRSFAARPVNSVLK